MRKLGLNVEVATSDWGTLLARRASKEPVDKGGWSAFHTSTVGPDMTDPAQNSQLRGNGLGAWFGWPSDAKIEALIAADIQEEAYSSVPYITIGQFDRPTAYRSNLTGYVPAPLPILWNIDKQ